MIHCAHGWDFAAIEVLVVLVRQPESIRVGLAVAAHVTHSFTSYVRISHPYRVAADGRSRSAGPSLSSLTGVADSPPGGFAIDSRKGPVSGVRVTAWPNR